jgi:LmbE family N-acetylglucosaminyl deacetylase
MRKRGLITLGVIVGVLALIVGGLYWAGRSLFYEPTARGVDSVIGELGGTRVLGVFAHPDDEQTVNGLFWRAKDRDGAYTAMITATRGEVGAFVVENQPDPEYAMSAEVGKKHEGWTIHASQANYMQESYILPNWLTYLLWDEEFYHVRDLRSDPLP